jgi:hypothetical protein
VAIGIGTLILALIERSEDIVSAGATTAVVMVVAALTPHDAWQEPIFRAADTGVGIAVWLGAASIGTWIVGRRNP